MNRADHVALIAEGVRDSGRRWLELGAGEGLFTAALADVLGDGAQVVAVDRDRWALAELTARVEREFPAAAVEAVLADFRDAMPAGPFDGALAANSLHFADPIEPVLAAIHQVLAPGARLVIVEYDATHGNPYVPHPISFERWTSLAPDAGFTAPRLLHRVPSRFLGSIYGAVVERAEA
jgi:ubiquinone/menaquinone biosynthesis C-methylase UbiE